VSCGQDQQTNELDLLQGLAIVSSKRQRPGGKGQPSQTTRLGNGGPTLRARARLTGV